MTDFRNRFKVLRDELSLTSDERLSMREQFSEAPVTALATRSLPTPFMSHFSLYFRSVSVAILIILVGAGGTVAAAEGALPGDTLYSVKLGVNERFERIAAIGTVARATVDVRHAEERIREVELLAAKGLDDTRAVADVASLVDSHIRLASEAAEELQSEGNMVDADTITAHIDATLSAHAEILEAQAENEDATEERRKLRALSVALSVSAEDNTPEAPDTSPRTAAYYQEVARSRGEEASRIVASLKDALDNNGVPEETIATLTEEYNALEAEEAEARRLLSEEDYVDAGERYEELRKRAYRAQALLTSAKRIGQATDKEVVINLEGDADAALLVEEPSASEAMLFTTMPPEETVRAKSEEERPPLRFWIRERSEGR